VTCTNCDTSFQLDDARVPNQGIRVRCSRCKEAFFLQHPSASPSDAVDAVASEAAQSGGTRPPDMTQDLPPGAQVQGDEDEHDWEFNVDPSEAKESQDEGQGAFGGLSQNGASGLALEGEEEAKNDPDDPVVEEEDEESAFGSVDDFSSLMEEDDQTRASDLDTGSQEAADDEQSSVHPAQPNLANAGQYAEQGRSEDLGEPENWDFFGDASAAPAATSSLDGGQASAAIGSVERTTTTTARLRHPAS
ncbi:MAG: zinc-ribbon domain-containing protein, partial [Deltaproteobacteria bacterium]|nr:zinc-ribbon domain-containing protein [Deltaproteobacteria bacterium]